MLALEGVHCSMYVSWFVTAGPRFLSVGIITNSFECLSLFSINFRDGIRLVNTCDLRLLSLIASLTFYSLKIYLWVIS
jgi:hypothetical protein